MAGTNGKSLWISAVVAVMALAPVPAVATTVSFSGAQSYTNILNPPGTGRCAPTYVATVNIEPGRQLSDGSSNLGLFGSTQSHCIVSTPPTPIVAGLFSFAFEDEDFLTGTYTGQVIATDVPDFFDLIEDFVATGGTGRFENATGAFTMRGSFFRGPNQQGPGFVTNFIGRFNGALTLAPVPEPATWAMMIVGFGALGAAARVSRRNVRWSLLA